MFQKADFISRSTTASFSLILLQRATVQSYNEVIFFPSHEHSLSCHADFIRQKMSDLHSKKPTGHLAPLFSFNAGFICCTAEA